MKLLTKILEEEISGVICDVCGNRCRKDGDFVDEYAILKASWGYCSKMDGICQECDICENCFDKISNFIKSIGGEIREKSYF